MGAGDRTVGHAVPRQVSAGQLLHRHLLVGIVEGRRFGLREEVRAFLVPLEVQARDALYVGQVGRRFFYHLEATLVEVDEGVDLLAVILPVEAANLVLMLVQRALHLVFLDVELGGAFVLHHVVVVDRHHCLVHRRRKLLPVVNMVRLESGLIERSLLNLLSVGQVESGAVDPFAVPACLVDDAAGAARARQVVETRGGTMGRGQPAVFRDVQREQVIVRERICCIALVVFVADRFVIVLLRATPGWLHFGPYVVEASEDFVAPVGVLELSLHNPFGAVVLLRRPNMCCLRGQFDLAVLGLVLADFRSVGFAGMALLPAVAARAVEARVLLAVVLFRVETADLLIKGYEEAALGPGWNRRAAVGSPVRVPHARLLLALSLSNHLHLLLQVGLMLFSEQETEVVVFFLVLLGEVELLLVAGRVVEAEVLGDRAFAGARDHRQRRPQLLVVVVLERNNHFILY